MDSIVFLVWNDVKAKMASMNYELEEGPDRNLLQERWGVDIRVKNIIVKIVCWEKPPAGKIKINTDGSLRSNRGTWGTAFRNHDGDVVRAAHGDSPHTMVDEIELDALEKALKMAQRYGFRDILVNTDSTAVVHYLKTRSPPWNVRHRCRESRG